MPFNVAYPTAIEIARQMNAGIGNGNGNAVKLVSAGLGVQSATELATAGFPTPQAVALKKHSGL